MKTTQRTSLLLVLAFAVTGGAIGMLLQFMLSSAGAAPLVPPISLALTLLVLGAILLVLGVALRRAVTRKSGSAVNPFHAVRLLAGAKAGQFVGALLGGFGGGLALQLLTRSVLPPSTSWLPMLFTLGAGIVLVVCGAITESLCRVPPNDPDEDQAAEPSAGADPA